MNMKSLLKLSGAVFVCCAAVMLLMARERSAALQSDAQDQSEITKVDSRYDKGKDETTVEFSQLALRGNETQRIFLSVSASYKGQKPKEPDDVIVIVSVLSSGSYRYPDVMAMQVLVDGKKLSDVLMINLDKRKADDDYLETIGTRMKYDQFKRLLKASAAEFQLQDLRLPITDAHLAKLRELDALLRPGH